MLFSQFLKPCLDQWKKGIHVQSWPKSSFQLPKFQAHRGFSVEGAKENTLAAFYQAKEKGFLMFECDCQLSKDKIPIIIHDYDLQRLAADKHLVKELTAAQLKMLAAVPTLKEVLTDPMVPSFVNIELKTKTKFDEALERKVAEVVIKAGAENRVLFSSFNPFSLWRISQYLPQVPRALLVSAEVSPENSIFLREMLLAPFLKIHLLHLEAIMVTLENLEFWKKKNIPIAVWTVNDPAQAKFLLEQGVVSVISDMIS